MLETLTTANQKITGRERSCTQCATIYRAQRSTSSYCSTSCRKKSNRGTPPKALGPKQWSPITKALHKVGYVGITGPVSNRINAPATYALTVPPEHAYGELSYHFNRKGWGCVSQEEFGEALRLDSIEPFYVLSTKAAADKLWRDRNTQRLQRLS